MEFSPRSTYETLADWESAWNRVPLLSRPSQARTSFREIAHYVGGAFLSAGFQLFENGGTPLLERRFGPYRHEILFVPAPKMNRRLEVPFAVRVHLSSSSIARVRSRFWRPPTRAPHIVACGDIAQFSAPNRHIIWRGIAELETARQIIEELHESVLPWFRSFNHRVDLRERLYEGTLPLIDDCTALELLLAEFDPFEARRYLGRMIRDRSRPPSYAEPVGFDLNDDRIGPITAYYRL